MLALLLGTVIAIPLTVGQVYGEENIDVSFSEAQAYIVVIGVLGGVTIAYMKWNKAVRENNAEIKENNKLKDSTLVVDKIDFNISLFLNHVIFATITSIPIAIAASLEQTELTLFTGFLIYSACIGTGQIITSSRK